MRQSLMWLLSARWLIGVSFVFIVVLALLVLGAQTTRADTANTFSTTMAVPAGGTLATAVSTSGVTITGSTPISGCPTTGIGTSAVTYTCSVTGAVAVGTPITQTFGGASGTIVETVTYNANGPITGSPAVADPSVVDGTCTAPASGVSTCSGQTPVTVPATGTLRLIVVGQATSATMSQTVSFVGPNTLGTCPRTDPPVGGLVALPIPNAFIGDPYTCGAAQMIPSGTAVNLRVSTQGAGTPQFHISANENAPIPATTAIPSPTTQTLTIGSQLVSSPSPGTSPLTLIPTLTGINPGSGAAGTLVTLTGTNLASVTGVLFGSVSANNGSCSATQCIVTVPAVPAGSTVNVFVTSTIGPAGSVQFTVIGAPASAAPLSTGAVPSVGTLTNIAFAGIPAIGVAGQPLTLNAAPAGTSSACGTIQSYSFDFGDGSAPQVGLSVTHNYAVPGTYELTLTVTDCAGVSGTAMTPLSISGASPAPVPATAAGGTAAPFPTPIATGPTVTVAYLPGWNLVAGPQGATVSVNSGPMYTFQGGDSSYEMVNAGASLQAGKGYWAYFPSGVTGALPASGPQTYSVFLPAGQYVMIGDPGSTPATVSGADVVVAFDPISNNYVPLTTLAPGQGAWAISVGGGAITVIGR